VTPSAQHGLLAACLLAAVHLFSSRIPFDRALPRRRWLSLGGGISVAYVFLHLLPELAQHQATLKDAAGSHPQAPRFLADLEHHAYFIALAGLATFYGLEQMALRDRRRPRGGEDNEQTGESAFWVSICAFTLYNGLIGYLLTQQARIGPSELYLFSVALGLHLVVNDYALHEHHRRRYRNMGRWVLSAAVLGGAVIGVTGMVPQVPVSVLVAFLAGGVVLNVLKEELPAERESSFGAFALGAAAYAALLTLVA
jgi:hypothetical protein